MNTTVSRVVCAEHDVVLEVCGCDLIQVSTVEAAA